MTVNGTHGTESNCPPPAADPHTGTSQSSTDRNGVDCRFGPTLADEFQGKGWAKDVWTVLLAWITEHGYSRVILWGGVLADNVNAIKFYETLGFIRAGSFTDDENETLIDMFFDLP